MFKWRSRLRKRSPRSDIFLNSFFSEECPIFFAKLFIELTNPLNLYLYLHFHFIVVCPENPEELEELNIKIGLASFLIISVVLSGVIMVDWTGAAGQGQNGPKDAAGSRDSASSVWPVNGHDLKHTGQSTVDTSSNTGDLLWRFAPEGTNSGIESQPAVGPDGTIYFGSFGDYDKCIYAFNPDGTKKWSFETGGWIRGSPAVDANGTIYFTSDDRNLYALNPDGSEKWKVYLDPGDLQGNVMSSSPMVLNNGTIYVGSDSGNLYAIGTDGTIKWTFKAGSWILASPAVADDGSIYVGDGYFLYKLMPDGRLLWKFPYTYNWAAAPAIGPSGIVYIPSDNYLYAIYPNGTFNWRFNLDIQGLFNFAIGGDGTIYCSGAGSFYAIDTNGALKWKHIEEDKDWNSDPPALGSEGTIYWISNSGFFYAFHPDGTIKWAHRIAGRNAQVSGPVIGPGGNIYVTVELDGSVNHYFGIMAFGKNGTYPEVPKPPTGLKVVKDGKNIFLQWDSPQIKEPLSVQRYEIINSKTSDQYGIPSGAMEGKVDGNITSYQYTPNEEPFTYFTVVAVNSNGESPTSTWVTATTGIIEPRLPPTNLEASQGKGYVNLTWDKPTGTGISDLMRYRVYRGNGTIDSDLIADVDPQVRYYNDTSVIKGINYRYHVTAVYKDRESGASNELLINFNNETILPPPGRPNPSNPYKSGKAVLVTTLAISSMSLLVIALAVGTDLGRFKLFTAMIPLHTKLKREKVLDHIERGRIIEYLIKNPGADYSEIGANLDLDNGILAYHLKVLERAEYLKSVTAGLHRRFYSFESTIPEDAHKTIQEMIIDYIIAHPDATRKELAKAIGAPLSTINYHCDLLVTAKVLQSSKIGRRKSYRLQKMQ